MTRTSRVGTAKCIFFKYSFEKKCDPFDFRPYFFHYPTKNNHGWLTFKTLAEIERDCNERQLNYA